MRVSLRMLVSPYVFEPEDSNNLFKPMLFQVHMLAGALVSDASGGRVDDKFT